MSVLVRVYLNSYMPRARNLLLPTTTTTYGYQLVFGSTFFTELPHTKVDGDIILVTFL